METQESRILSKIRRKGRGAVYCNKDFLGLGSRAAVDQALNRLARRGELRRIARGLYYLPKSSRRLGELSPDMEKVANAAARKTGATIAPTGAAAANALGLSTQVPAKAIFLTDRRLRPINIGKSVVEFRQVAPRVLRVQSEASTLLLQALRYLGRNAIDDDMIKTIRARLNATQRQSFAEEARYSMDWIVEVARKIATEA